ncbi:type I-E CRISPR-associated protein Cse2/CasB [Streptomyces sp. TRM 70351]|uniref:type I-E CRISPR-associated protein Cse2/CasB n=1 Tax=Streptomyces sp. TRM 70351 TaxID=3116552 RepID=UPI002E7BAB15|nr:type I-E CRISPR-associated protein Cse2/CasB [Streptomyces sp. TRM 70351]MEE1931294.1 type I-E CRISPR-associated protein Cse2/CasB [Streptomyces sp. TRM 70351]
MNTSSTTTDTATNKPPEQPTKTPSAELATWLTNLVRTRQYGQLADLRRPRARTTTHILAAAHAPADAPKQREVFEQVAFLFAVYHRGAIHPSYGYGSLGTAMRKIGSPAGRGPNDPGATRLADRIVSSRRIPWRHLQHAVTRLRSCDQPPPSWRQLIDDLDRWTERGRPVPYSWAVNFHTPVRNTTKGTTK